MSEPNIFHDEWRQCLRAHYEHVLREQDWANGQSLGRVLVKSGFTEEEIIDIQREILGPGAFETTPEEIAAPEVEAEFVPEAEIVSPEADVSSIDQPTVIETEGPIEAGPAEIEIVEKLPTPPKQIPPQTPEKGVQLSLF